MDGNFTADHQRMRRPREDVPLASGTGHLVATEPYKAHLKTALATREVCTKTNTLVVVAKSLTSEFNAMSTKQRRRAIAQVLGQMSASELPYVDTARHIRIVLWTSNGVKGQFSISARQSCKLMTRRRCSTVSEKWIMFLDKYCDSIRHLS